MFKRTWMIVAIALAALAAGLSFRSQARDAKQTEMPAAAAFRILLGVGDKEPAAWDGSVKVAPGEIYSIQGWRFRKGIDTTDNRSSWKCSSGLSLTQVGHTHKGDAPPMLENGVVVATTTRDPGARFDVKTKQGTFFFTAGEIPWGQTKSFLGGSVKVDRVPNSLQLTDSLEDEDFPAIAQSGDTVYMTYVRFTHAARLNVEWGQMGDYSPKNLDFVSRPVGGDQVFLMRYSKSKRTWSAPEAVSAPKQDVVRPAVAVDGQGRVWVFWAAGKEGSFDIYAKSLAGGKWSSEMRLTKDPGTDLNPVAATDSKGRVWVAWQGFRNDNLEILASVQEGDGFALETVVSFSKASDWDPSIATAANGEVAVAWDTYDKGDYDVYFRKLRMDGGIRMDAPVPVAASTRFEARSSAAYDPQNRLWVAYEVSGEKWGKDNGPYSDKSGIGLYKGHSIQVKCFQGKNAFTTSENVAKALPSSGGKERKARKGAKSKIVAADEEVTSGALNSFPRLAVDSNGVVYLAYRTRSLPGRTDAGTVWVQQAVYFDGTNWNGPIAVPHADQWSDDRPALAAIGAGDLMMITASDHRQEIQLGQKKAKKGETALSDEVNSDVFAEELSVNAAAKSAQLKAIPAETVSAPDSGANPERSQVAMLRKYRVTIGSEQAQIMRGEFHRHTELSYDGTGDGPLIDAYRYMIDAASMDWGACCDHDNGVGEYPWWIQQKMTDAYHLGGDYVAMFGFERSVGYPEGHRNAVFAQRGIRPLPRLKKSSPEDKNPNPPHAPDTQLLYQYLRKYDGIVASHTSGTNMGTDWRDNDPIVEPVVEIYQGCRQNYEMPGAPRTMTADNAIGGWRPLGFVSLALKKGYRLGFQSSSDHGSTHISYCNLWVTKPTREGIIEAFHKRRIYGATDNILADVRCEGHFMGEEFSTSEAPAISVKLAGTGDFAKVHIIKDGEYVYSIEPKKRNVEFVWKDAAAQKGKTSYYYVRGEQANGELVWASPMWITYR
jgi:hypothetical protein